MVESEVGEPDIPGMELPQPQAPTDDGHHARTFAELADQMCN